MNKGVQFVLAGLLLGSAAHAAEPNNCTIHKGLYDSWLSLSKRSPRTMPKVGALLGGSRSTPEAVSAEDIYAGYQNFFQCLAETKVPAGDDGGRSMCKDAAGDRLAALVCEVALYVKNNRTAGTDFLDALPASKKGAELIWDLDEIAVQAAAAGKPFPPLFASKGPVYAIIDELFVMALDDRDTAMAKYFHIAGTSAGTGAQYMDSQIKLLIRESPMLVVKQWQVLRQYQPKLKKILADFSKDLSAPEMTKIQQGISGFCPKDNLDCPEIRKVFGRP